MKNIFLTNSEFSSKYTEADRLHRKKFIGSELKRLVLKSITLDTHLSISIRLKAQLLLTNTCGSATFIKNRCIVTGRPHGIIRMYRLSRIAFRKIVGQGYLPGVNKSSW